MPPRPRTAEFVDSAPVRAVASREIAADAEHIFAVLADADSWPRWFPGVTAARWLTPGPYGVGSRRQVRVGPVAVDEEFIAWEPGRRFGFTFVGSSVPIARAGVEMVELEPLGADRTRVTYTMAVDVPGAGVVSRLAPLVGRSLGRGLDGLAAEVRARAS